MPAPGGPLCATNGWMTASMTPRNATTTPPSVGFPTAHDAGVLQLLGAARRARTAGLSVTPGQDDAAWTVADVVSDNGMLRFRKAATDGPASVPDCAQHIDIVVCAYSRRI